MEHVIHAKQFDREKIRDLFAIADRLAYIPDKSMRGHIMASLFYEPSTRTRLSFETSMLRLGGKTISVENAAHSSSATKGETLEDTIRVVANYANVIVLRHAEQDAAERAARVSPVPILNAGSGPGEHPTQALLDLYTIHREVGRLHGLTIALAGDLKYGRTVRSLATLLTQCRDVHLALVSPKELTLGTDIKKTLHQKGVVFKEYTTFEPIIHAVDVLYQTRIQKERFKDPAEYERLKGSLRVTRKLAQQLRPGAILMHPLPRVDEIAPDVDDLPSAAYFRQAHYGMLIRMALLKYVLRG